MILFLDGGYTLAAGNETCAEIIQKCLQHEELVLVKLEEDMDWNSVYRYLEDAHAIVLAADVYLDSVPSLVLRFLEKVEQAVIGGESIGGRFYAVLYTELYEGEQTSVAMDVLKNFCVHANIAWGRGLGIGGNKMETRTHKDVFGAGVTKTRQITEQCLCRSTRFLSGKKYREQMCILNQKKCQERGIFAK